MAEKISIIVVAGPTASGKTKLGVEIAKRFNGEIVSADSMQIYKGMRIATAKPTEEEMQNIPHYMMDFLDPSQSYSVALYAERAKKIIEDIYLRNKMPVIVGGTGLYIKSLLENITFAENSNNEVIRKEYAEKAEKFGIDILLEELKNVDCESYNKLSEEKNLKRIIRALEVYRTTGVTFSEHNKNSKNIPSPYRDVRIGLKCRERQNLYNRINTRVDSMVCDGLLEEAKTFLEINAGETAKMAIGYKELLPYFENKISLEEALEHLKRETRRYAKRQLTWFTKDPKINWIDTDIEENFDNVFKKACYIIENSGILI